MTERESIELAIKALSGKTDPISNRRRINLLNQLSALT